jgi:TRAP-type C4-dicarboxylate transport system permease small subunit
MALTNVIQAFITVVKHISKGINSVGGAILFLMMLLTAMDVLLRYIFNRPITGSYEITEYMMAIVVSSALAYCAVVKGHVVVDLVISRFPSRVQAILNSVHLLISFALFVFVTRQSYLYIFTMAESERTSAVLLIPIFPFIAILTIGLGIYTLQLLADLVDTMHKAVKA